MKVILIILGLIFIAPVCFVLGSFLQELFGFHRDPLEEKNRNEKWTGIVISILIGLVVMIILTVVK